MLATANVSDKCVHMFFGRDPHSIENKLVMRTRLRSILTFRDKCREGVALVVFACRLAYQPWRFGEAYFD